MTTQDVRNLHAQETADAYSSACVEGDCSWHDDEGDCPVTHVDICGYCYDRANEPETLAEWMIWPCETIRALDTEPTDGAS